jgi:hypothetical protein
VTWHPTTNRIQTHLLTLEELSALEAWPHGLEYFYRGSWGSIDSPPSWWIKDAVYRGKPAPVVTRMWFNVYKYQMSDPYKTREQADKYAGSSRIDVRRIDTCNGVSTAHLEGLE